MLTIDKNRCIGYKGEWLGYHAMRKVASGGRESTYTQVFHASLVPSVTLL